MSINSLRPNTYRPVSQPRQPQPKFGGDDAGQTPDFPQTKEALADQFRKQAEELKEQSDRLERLATSLHEKNLGAQADSASQPEDATPSEGTAKTGSTESGNSQKEKTSTLDPNQVKPTWTPREERTKTKVLMDVTSHYLTRGKVVSDLLWSIGIGAVCAIGSPVMAVTIPTTMAVFGGIRLLQLAAKAFSDPTEKDGKIDKMYQKWIEADEAKAKKAAGKSS